MKEAKDLFSKQATNYAAYRPVYPEALYDFLFNITQRFDNAWDCGTGNGQVAGRLAGKFRTVFATDLSENQITNAVQKDNIIYKQTRAEHTDLPGNSIDLITIGTALHWFDFEAFYAEVRRVARPDAHVVAWAYAPFRSETAIDNILDNFVYNILGPYWDPERKWVDEEYKTIPFPFEEVPAPQLNIKMERTLEQFVGFLHSWSSVQHYINKNGKDPVDIILADLQGHWHPGETKQLVFPLFIRAGKVNK